MSRDRFYDPQASLSVARVRKRTGHVYSPDPYMGNQRAPKLADEVGAVAVVDLLFGGRIAVYPHDEDWMRIRRLD